MDTTAREAETIYEHFEAQRDRGVGHIATSMTIEVLIRTAKNIHATRILELGGGGGTLTYALLKHTDAHVDVYEDLDFCRKNLNKNCAEFAGRYALLDTYSALPPRRTYDLMVIDGPGTGEKSAVVERFIGHLDSVRLIYVEGHRYIQRLAAIRALARRYKVKRIRFENVSGMGTSKGGVLYEAIPEASQLNRRIAFWYVYASEYLHWKTNVLLRRVRKIGAGLKWRLYHS